MNGHWFDENAVDSQGKAQSDEVHALFGESAEGIVVPNWASNRIAARKPKSVCDNDGLPLRQNFDLPPLKEGHRYRIRVAGNSHNNMGEFYTIHFNGKQLVENREGVTAWRRQGNCPRGVTIYPESSDLLKGRITLAVSSSAMENFSADRFIPPGAALSVWIEEQKLPPVGQ